MPEVQNALLRGFLVVQGIVPQLHLFARASRLTGLRIRLPELLTTEPRSHVVVGFSFRASHQCRKSSPSRFASHHTSATNPATPPSVPSAISVLAHHVLAAANDDHAQPRRGPNPAA